MHYKKINNKQNKAMMTSYSFFISRHKTNAIGKEYMGCGLVDSIDERINGKACLEHGHNTMLHRCFNVYLKVFVNTTFSERTAGVVCISNTITFHKSTLVARGANTQLDPSCVSASLATNVNLLVCFAERLFISSSISH